MNTDVHTKFSVFIDSIREAIESHRYAYALTEINLAQNKEDVTIKYQVIGTGKESESIGLLSIYNDDDTLLKFRPQDIKIISTTASLLNSAQERYQVVYMQLKAENGDRTISLRSTKTSKKFRTTINALAKNKEILDNIIGSDAFMLGAQYSV